MTEWRSAANEKYRYSGKRTCKLSNYTGRVLTTRTGAILLKVPSVWCILPEVRHEYRYENGATSDKRCCLYLIMPCESSTKLNWATPVILCIDYQGGGICGAGSRRWSAIVRCWFPCVALGYTRCRRRQIQRLHKRCAA